MAQAHAASGDIIDVRPLGAVLGDRVSTAFIKSTQLEWVHLVVPAGKGLPEHHVSGEITVQCIDGLIALTTPSLSHHLAPGQLVHLAARGPHALVALADSTALRAICLASP